MLDERIQNFRKLEDKIRQSIAIGDENAVVEADLLLTQQFSQIVDHEALSKAEAEVKLTFLLDFLVASADNSPASTAARDAIVRLFDQMAWVETPIAK